MLIYITATNRVVSIILVVEHEEEGRVQNAHNISYEPWKAIKSQALADFIVEWTKI